jgi:hypothetical protein
MHSYMLVYTEACAVISQGKTRITGEPRTQTLGLLADGIYMRSQALLTSARTMMSATTLAGVLISTPAF